MVAFKQHIEFLRRNGHKAALAYSIYNINHSKSISTFTERVIFTQSVFLLSVSPVFCDSYPLTFYLY